MGVAIITGAARGIGAATAVALAEAGHHLVLIDQCADDPRLSYALGTREELEAVAEQTQAEVVVGNAADESVVREAVTAADEFGGVDIAIAAAGVIAGEGPAWEVTAEAWSLLDETNINAVRVLAAATIPLMLTRPRPRFGRFIALGSPIAWRATPRLAAYAASKAAVESFVKSMAADLAGTDITANTVLPGSTNTELLQHSASVYDLAEATDFVEHHVIDRLVEPEEVAASIAFLCSEHASAITGASFAIDGGMSAR